MVDKVKIDIISDVVCPWCIIGYKNLQQAIAELDVADRVEIQWQPFELNPDMPPEGEELRAHSARKYGSTPQSSAQFRIDMTNRGKEVGFSFDYFDNMKIVNTRENHILLEYAKEYGLQTELKLRLFSAFFSEHKDVSDRDVLRREAAAVGLNADEAMATLDSDDAIQAVIEHEKFWQGIGVTSVPTFVFNQSSGIAGAHPVETFKSFLAKELNISN
ncbi:DsbA family oxidoreductase [Psychrosphaera sp. 1_MG-2023]|uniref:DsbA family oxidoreductase n=1 Tax=Psychrosphaera sp. 1_MG-2023 TaxID=3062643 RepID=UPI0026E2D2C0|nr:DsbA family oxidoreductase [Psychrosphaera sp. 1_MG-2023]MDO6717776.1 DsbA family oxidoreductase [Psychrosphaera sp. 1_MG-2023]